MNLREISNQQPVQCGFTLVELMLVVSLVITLNLAASAIGISYYQSQILRDTSDALVGTLREAQGFALAGKESSAFGVRVNDESYVLFEGGSYESRLPEADIIVPIAGDIVVTGPREIIFSVFTGTTNSDETLTLSLGDKEERIEIAQSGYIQ